MTDSDKTPPPVNGKDKNNNGKTINHINGGGDELQSVPLTVNAQYLKDLSFESPAAPEIFPALKNAPDIAIDIDVKTAPQPAIGPQTHEVELSVTVTARSGDSAAFVCETVYAGLFTLGELPPEVVQPLLLVECPRILFPFVRAIIGDATRNGGFPPLMINPIDFNALYQRKIGNAA